MPTEQNTEIVTNADIISRLQYNEIEIRELHKKLDVLHNDTKNLQGDTKNMVEAFDALKGAFQVLEWIAKVAKPLIIIVATIGSITLYIKGLK